MTARAQKADVIVIGSGTAAYALAYFLGLASRRVALLSEREPLAVTLPDFPLWHPPGRREAALRGLQELEQGLHESLAARVHRIEARVVATAYDTAVPNTSHLPLDSPEAVALAPGFLFDLAPLAGGLATAVESAGGVVERGARVRGISVIENEILGVVAETARWDARVVVNAADDERAMAIARMAREPLDLTFHAVPLAECPTVEGLDAVVTPDGAARWRDEEGRHFLLGESSSLEPPVTCRTLAIIARASLAQPLLAGPAPRVRGSWRLLGTAGWPLVAVGAAAALASDLVAAG